MGAVTAEEIASLQRDFDWVLTEEVENVTKELKAAIERLTLNDRSVGVSMETSLALGQGWRLGFLGILHMEVFTQRLEQEFNAQVIVTAPSVPYQIRIKVQRVSELVEVLPSHLRTTRSVRVF